MKAIWSIIGLVERYRLLLPLLLIVGVAAAFAESLGLGLLMPFAATVLGENYLGAAQGGLFDKLTGLGDIFGAENRAILLGCLVVALVGFKSVLWIVYLGAVRWIGERAVHKLRVRIFQQLCSVDYGVFSSRAAGDYYNLLSGEMSRVGEGIGAFFMLLGRTAVAGVFFVILLTLSWRLFLASTAIFAVSSFAMGKVSRLAHSYGRRATGSNEALSNHILCALTGMRTLRAFGQEAHQESKFSLYSDRSRREIFRAGLVIATAGPFMETIFIAFFVLLVFFSDSSGIPLAQLITFIVLMYRVVPHVRGAEEARVQLGSCLGVIEAVKALLTTTQQPQALGTKPPVFNEVIRFQDVNFGYKSGETGSRILEDVTFAIPKGATVALVGASGSGKSTIINLLLGFYAPSSGRITVDGTPLSDLDLLAWRRMTGFAGQDSQLFPGTISENIAFGRPDAPLEAIEDVAGRASITEFSARMPEGLDTKIGREGLDLSGGQRQRIAFARALLVDPELLILDEATNALDNVTEATIQKTLIDIGRSKTVVIVAHRLRTIRRADWVIALDKGRVSEQGTPEDLLRRNEAFARLYEIETERATVQSG